MTGIKTTLKNCTKSEIVLKTGNAGVFSKSATILNGKTYDVHSTSNETYKLYWCAVQPNNDKVLLSSDDCIEFKEIQIKQTPEDPKKFSWEGTVKRDGTVVGNGTPATGSSSTGPTVVAPSTGGTPPANANPGFLGRLFGRLLPNKSQ